MPGNIDKDSRNKMLFLRKLMRVSFMVVALVVVAAYFYLVYPFWGMPFNASRHGNPPRTPAWALECWLWEDDVNTAAYEQELLDGYAAHDIPVRTILIDSPWSYRYNDFDIDTVRYPHPEKWFLDLQDRGYRVVLWMTSMVNSYNKGLGIKYDSAWFDTAANAGYLASDGQQNGWWKGRGGFVDYSNAEAMKWWHGMQQRVFDLGIDGWKLDGTATLFWKNIGPIPFFYKKTAGGMMTTRTYMDHYYRDEYRYGLDKNPAFVTLSRSVDRSFHPEGFAPVDASPVNWVGDQEHKWVTDEMLKEENTQTADIALKGIQGFESAISSIIKSAELGYNIIGSDVAGFSGNTIPPRLYIRWAQFSAFCGLFLNGGHGERRLWKRSALELEIIRKYAWLHTELVPYMYHYVVTAHRGGRRLQTPVEGKYQFMFGDDLLVAPIYRDQQRRKILLPEGKWRYLFDDGQLLQGPAEFVRDYPLDKYPVFVKEGAIIPMKIQRDYSGIGTSDDADYLTFLIYPAPGDHQFEVFREATSSTILHYNLTDKRLLVSLNGEKCAHLLKIFLNKPPGKIELDGHVLVEDKDFTFDKATKKLCIRTASYEKGAYKIYYQDS